ncbi:hypothetical protein [Streptomyces sp. NPDC048172]|uniref:hypothetical protein n=1 Tax=Streptomyces sp. NPDC048172 TaxID=3365505 RepID=UPI003723E7F8
MSYPPPPPGQSPNPYAGPPQGAPAPQGPYAPQGYPAPAPMPGPQGHPAYPAYPGGPMNGMPGMPGMVPPKASMPGITIAARVLLFVAGAIWGIMAVGFLIAAMAASDAADAGFGEASIGLVMVFSLVFAAMSALHIVPASLFGRGRVGTRVTAIVAASLNTLCAVLGFLGSLTPGRAEANPLAAVLWLAVSVCTIVFCSMSPSGQWFGRPRY